MFLLFATMSSPFINISLLFCCFLYVCFSFFVVLPITKAKCLLRYWFDSGFFLQLFLLSVSLHVFNFHSLSVFQTMFLSFSNNFIYSSWVPFFHIHDYWAFDNLFVPPLDSEIAWTFTRWMFIINFLQTNFRYTEDFSTIFY